MNKPNRTRNHTLTIRLNDSEYNTFIQHLTQSGLTKQDFVLDAITKPSIISSDYISELHKLNQNVANYNRKVSGMAVNINQIAHKANATDVVDIHAIENATNEISKVKKEGENIWHLIRSSMATVLHAAQ